MSFLLLIAGIATVTVTAACVATGAAYAAAGAATRAVDDFVAAISAASQVESGDLPVSGYQGS